MCIDDNQIRIMRNYSIITDKHTFEISILKSLKMIA